ncbi:uncharacterized protein LOC100176392 isoform X1 [Ciona intestinalis]
MRITLLLPLLFALCKADCPPGWQTRGSYCYDFQQTLKTWSESESICQALGGHLVSFADNAERDWVYATQIGPSAAKWWIGLNDIQNENTWVWSDGTTVLTGVFLWRPGEPSNSDDNQHCAVYEGDGEITANTWNDENCGNSRYFVCKSPLTNVVELCDTDRGFVSSGSYCYLFVDLEKNWHDANDYCDSQYNAYLTSVTDQLEQDFVYNFEVTNGNQEMWIGLSDTVSPGNLQWASGHDVLTFGNWADNEPNFADRKGSTCVEMTLASTGKWVTARCSKEKKFVCRKGQKKTCPDGWVYGNGKCYKFYMNSNLYGTWSEARVACQSQNADMLEIETLEEQLFIASYFAQWRDDGILQVWLGISDVGSDQYLRYADGHDIQYTQWDNGALATMRPNIEECAWIYTGKNTDNWELGNCAQIQSFICEVTEGTVLSPIDIPVLEYACKDGWRLFEDHCYLFDTTQRTWDDAESFCLSSASGVSHLASIHDDLENSFMSGNLRGQSWIGMNDKVSESNWVWTDGSPSNFFNWKTDQPSQDGDCMRMIGTDDYGSWGAWNDIDCTQLHLPICETSADHITPGQNPGFTTAIPADDTCGDGYLHNPSTHKCYKIVSDHLRQWADARLHCQSEGGDLVSINSPEEQGFIEFHIAFLNVWAVWTGGLDSYNGPDFFPDVIDAFDGGWRWSDGSPFNFVNWVAGEPNNESDEDCMEIRSDTGLWNDVPCGGYYGYVCERPDPAHPPDEEPECTSSDCCYRHLGVEVGGSIPDDQLIVSSQMDAASGSDRGRLNTFDQYVDALGLGGPGRGAWIASKDDTAPWFQVNLGNWIEVRGIVTQGRNGLNQPHNQNDWVTKYSVMYMTNPVKGVFEYYKETDGTRTIYKANFDQDTQVTNIFTRPIVTTAIRIMVEECRHNHYCAMRVEILGCTPSCASSLGVSSDGFGEFPLLSDDSFTASSEQVGFESYNARLDYSQGSTQISEASHYNLPSTDLTWSSAQAYCMNMGADLCRQVDVCPNGVPIIGVQQGDQWAPIRDSYNNWVELGNDNSDTPGRVCWNHNDHYGPPDWGTITGPCTPWDTPQDPCPHKGNVFCCPVNLKSWKPTSNSNQWVQVDLGDVRKVAGVLLQGDPYTNEWVTDYYVAFSTDGVQFATYLTPTGDKELFPGPPDSSTIVEGYLREALTARYIRILPQTWHGNVAMRFDVIGCNVGDIASCTDTGASYDDDQFVLNCPGGCDQGSPKVWGTGIYTQNSFICAAAIHDGRIIADHGGTVTVKKTGQQGSYTGSSHNGITSNNFGSFPNSFMFQGDHLGCPSGWFGWKNWCYYLPRKNHLVDYSEATQRCQSYGAELVSVLDQGEQDFIINTIFFDWGSAEDVWIGLNDFETSNYFKWSDGSTVSYTNWNFNEPGGDGSGHCTKMYKFSGFWNNKDCTKELNYMCKMDKLPVNQAQQAVDGCPSGWQGNEASCYLFDITPSVWVNAEDYCSDVGGHLVTINNYFEQMYITSQAAQTSHPDDGENFLIGLAAYLDSSGGLTYKWSSGEPVTFTAWDKDEPDIRHTCNIPFQFEGVEYYDCVTDGDIFQRIGPWCSPDPVYTSHPVPCEGREDGMVGCITLDKDTGFWSQSRPVGCGSPGYRICELPRTGYTTPMIPTPPSPNGNCPDGWYGWSNATFCYQINEMTDPTQQLNWETAKLHCESQGANLASIHSKQEETIITTGVTGADQSYAFWIGLKRQDDGMMGWSDKTPLSFTDWGNDEPNNHNGREECTEAYLSPDSQYWNDLNCDAARNWICKVERGKDLLPAFTPPTGTLSPQICGSDVEWVAYTSSYTQQQKCYYFANSPVKSWKSANDYCATLGGSLVTIQTLDEQEFVTARGTKTGINALWIGMVQDGMNGPYIWIDGTPLTFENWIGGQPNDNNGKELCVLMYTYAGLWSDDNCGLPNGFICQKRTTATPGMPAPTPVVPGGCPAGWTTYGSKCYLEVGLTDNSLRKNWNDAETYCNTQSAYLASVPNAYYNSFLTSQLFGATINIWIGFNAQGTSRTFKWSDNEDVTYTNWAPDEPNNSGGLEECGEIIWSSDKAGQWNDIPCTEVRPFFCNRFRSTEFSQDNNPVAPDCPPNHNFVQWDTGCYKTYTDTSGYKSWNDASMACANEGTQMGIKMDLASVWNVYEESFIHSMFWPQEGTTNFDSMWIGLNFQYNSSTGATSYQWTDGSPVVYTKWGTNEPQNPTNGQGCAHMDNKGLWYMNTNVGECSSMQMAYVCKHETLVIPPQTPGIGECEATWLPLGDYCYSIEFGDTSVLQRSFGDADAECQSRMAYLASVHSDIENKALLSWLNEKTAWLGLKRNGWGGWDWLDGTAVDYTNWGENEPNNAGETGEACVEMYNNGKWNDNFCSNLRGYVCKKHKSYSTCNFPDDDRVDCGYDGISEYECVTRGCCWDEAGGGPHICFYSKADAQCLDKGGQCKDYRTNKCELGYEQYLCSGSGESRCCFECSPDDADCNQNVQEWNNGDSACESGNYGICQYNSNYCPSSVYESNKCGGPANRQCCVTNPVTLPPEVPLTTTPPKQTVTYPPLDTTTLQPPPPVQTTTTPKATDGPTEVVLPGGNGGLDAGGIAGIVIAVLFIIGALVAAGVIYQRGNTKIPFTMSFGGSKESSSVAGFDNPIRYDKDTVTLATPEDEFDA